MSYEFVIVERVGRVGVVTLNRPDQLNTLHPGQGREMREAVFELDADPEIGAIVMTGAGRAFCAGGDVRGWKDKVDAGEAGDIMARAAERSAPANESWADIWRKVKPAVVAVNGLAIGAGLTLTLGADYRIASEKARLSMRFAAVGVTPEIRSTALLPQICGFSNAMDLMISGAIVDAAHALRIGLVNEIAPHETLRDRAIEKAAEYARNHPDTTRAIKQLVWRNFMESDLSEVARREIAAFAAAQRRPSHAEAVRAFVEKRAPDFYGAVSRDSQLAPS
jgi:enoyl-CoA hydratase/carnithine racemase